MRDGDVNCPHCGERVAINWSDADYLTEFDKECSSCEREFRVYVEMTPWFSAEKRTCEKCGNVEIPDDVYYCESCKDEIRRNKEASCKRRLVDNCSFFFFDL